MLVQKCYHEKFMDRCLSLAMLAGRQVKSNPNVGALVVCKGRVIGEGYHKDFGCAHAEVNAINSVPHHSRALLSQSTLYVTLEPCNHYGKTPPCTDLILEHKIPRVVIGTLDPHQIMAGKSVELLRNAGVDVILGVNKEKCDQLILPFKANLNKRPYVILKIVKSKDNYIGVVGKKVWLSNALSTAVAHQWRSECDGILIGTNTAVVDNPALTVRHIRGNHPVRFVIDNHKRIPETHLLYADDLQTVVISDAQISNQLNENKSYLRVRDSHNILELLEEIWKMKIYRLLVEGGAKLISSFIESGFWDEARIVTTANRLGEGISAPLLEGHLFKKYRLVDNEIVYLYNEANLKS